MNKMTMLQTKFQYTINTENARKKETFSTACDFLLFPETGLQSATFIVAIFPHKFFLPERKLLQSMRSF